MTLVPQDDPYHALGLTKEASAADIKSAYRKLVLKHHPDKVQDETLKQAAADLFHKVQSAWEKIGDEEKRMRYDAKAHLDSLRKEASERERSSYGADRSDMRPSPFRSDSRSYQAPRDMDRGSYRTEEIRPQGGGYFGDQRPLDRRDFDVQHERPRRTPPKDDRRSKVQREDSKEAERLRQREKVRQATKATARDRDYKYAYAQPEVGSASDSDHYERRRSPRERVEEHRPSERYFDQGRRQSEDTSSRYVDEKLQRKHDDVRDYIERTAARRQYSERRPSPTRVSSRDHTDYVKDASGRPVQVRRGSGRPKTSSRDDIDLPSRRARREAERSGDEYDEFPRRPPGFSHAKSAPNDIHIPYDKPRANSAQLSSEQMKEYIPSPIKRADSMPQQPSRREESRSKPMRASALRQTQVNDDYETRKSAQSYPAPSSRSPKEYADDYEKPTPDGYVIETREPSRRMTRSPEPMREKSSRSYPSRYSSAPAPPPLNTRVTSYAYTDKGAEVLPQRPKLSREGSSRKDSYLLYGEVPKPASPRDRQAYPGSERAQYQEVRPDYKMNSGPGRRSSTTRSPSSYLRGNSFNMPSVSA